jgi:hypothetical protein
VASRIQCLLEGRSTLEGPPARFSPAQIEAAYFGLRGAQTGGAQPGDGLTVGPVGGAP